MNQPQNFTYQPIIIIGAARSGTNMLRDILTRLPGFGTWPCDEINYIWRRGNTRYPTDEFQVEQATPVVKDYIRHAFTQLAHKQNLDYVVEKTCANSLRVAFVEQIVPEAKLIFIVRDGRDVVASAIKRWVAPLDIPYLLKKARYVPVADVPYYGMRYFWNRIYRLLSRQERLAFWGPRFEGMEEALSSRSLPEVCAMQWVRCVQKSECDLNQIDSTRVHRVRYEDFVIQPDVEFRRISQFLEIDNSERYAQKILCNVSTKSVGKWKQDLASESLEAVETLIQSTLKRYGYR